jgi:uncharacterized protein YlxW (UPF0749 family)
VTLFNAKDAINDVKQRRADAEAKPKKLNPFQRIASDNHDLRDENDRLRAKISALSARVDEHDERLNSQEAWNAEAQKRVGQLQSQSAAGDVPCPGCGQPSGVGMHGVTCFQVAE